MTLTCECDHPRSEHEGGKTSYVDSRVENCNHPNCTCKHYNADKQTRKRKTELWLASFAIPSILVILCVAGFIISYVIIDFTFQDYIIMSEIEYKIFKDGIEIQRDTFLGMPINPHEALSYQMKMLVAMIFLIVGMFGGLFLGMSYHEKRYFELIRGEKN